MFALTDAEKRKLRLVETILMSYSESELMALAEADVVTQKLKGDVIPTPIITSILSELSAQEAEISTLNAEIFSVKHDIRVLAQLLQNILSQSTDYTFLDLKNKYSIT